MESRAVYMLGGGAGGMSEVEMDQLGKKEHFSNNNKNSDILESRYDSALIMLLYQPLFLKLGILITDKIQKINFYRYV